MAEQLTQDPIYQTVEPGDFRSMVEVDRYAKRSDAFDQIIGATHDHFWDPMDSAGSNRAASARACSPSSPAIDPCSSTLLADLCNDPSA